MHSAAVTARNLPPNMDGLQDLLYYLVMMLMMQCMQGLSSAGSDFETKHIRNHYADDLCKQ